MTDYLNIWNGPTKMSRDLWGMTYKRKMNSLVGKYEGSHYVR